MSARTSVLVLLAAGIGAILAACGSSESKPCEGTCNTSTIADGGNDAPDQALAQGEGAFGANDGGLADAGPPPFPVGHVFVAGFNDKKVYEYDATLASVTSWTHPSFAVADGPAGMVFDSNGHLVVAAFDQFCVFSAPGVLATCHPKTKAQRTENVIFDIDGNLYTTTSTGGTDEIHKYDANYTHIATFTLPTGQLTGITCDPGGNLYVASQITNNLSTVYKIDRNGGVLGSFDVAGNAEGLQFASDGNMLVALSGGVGIARVTPVKPSSVVTTVSNAGLFWPVPVTVDQAGRIYTGDFEDGAGNAGSDLFIFDPAGNVVASRRPSELHGPFGLVVAGTVLPCGAYRGPR